MACEDIVRSPDRGLRVAMGTARAYSNRMKAKSPGSARNQGSFDE
jgi:hypothetical protein